ncbi:restriction endonuclease subunit S [Priestia megaterium]
MDLVEKIFINNFGEIPNGVSIMTLEEISNKEKGSIISGPFGSNISSKFFVDFGVPVIRGNNLTEDWQVFNDNGYVFVTEEKAKSLKTFAIRGDLIFTAAGTIGQVGYIPKTSLYPMYVISNKQLRARLDEKIVNPKYAYYWFSSYKMNLYIKLLNTGSTIPLINLSILKKLPIPIPSLTVQNKIVEIIEAIENKILLNNEMNFTLQEMADSIFKHWFVDFEFPNEKGAPYKSSNGKFIESEIGVKPEGWELLKIGEFIKVADGTHDSPKKQKNGYPLITSKHIKNNNLLLNDANLISEKDYKEINKRSRVDNRDILISMIGTVGITYFVQEEEVNFAIKNIGLFKTSEKLEYSNYIYLYLTSKDITNYIKQRITGSTQQYISLGELRNIPLLVPKEEIVNNVNRILDPIFNSIKTNTIQNQTLLNLRDTILPKLMSGEIRLTEVEKEVEECL